MKRIFTCWAACLILFLTANSTYATHIVGAELFYRCINPALNQYQITLKMYRDCQNGQAEYDNPIYLFVFSASTGQRLQDIAITFPGATRIIPENIDACVAIPPVICVEEGIYETVITLPPRSGGYDLAWARCCRNGTINNLSNPLGEGVSFLAHIPDPAFAQCNTMPQFNQVPPIFLCAGEPFTFDHSARDADGDSLSYALTNPYTGLNTRQVGAGNPQQGGPPPIVTPFNNPMGPPPYQNVRFGAGFSFQNPFGSRDFSLDPATGFINVTPNQPGIFVYSISVFEWRNGELLSENRRDYQIHVIPCLPQDLPPEINHDLSGLNSSNDTIFVNGAEPFCYPFTVTDVNTRDQLESFAVSSAFGIGNFVRPAATISSSGVNPIQGEVCWAPSCILDGQVVPLIIGAKDISDCPNVSNVFDTVYISISAPPNEPPVIQPDLSGQILDNDTIIVRAESDFCLDIDITDPNMTDELFSSGFGDIFNGDNPPEYTVTGINPLMGQLCWTPSCDLKDQLVSISVSARDVSDCGTSMPIEKEIYLKIIAPDNIAPTINTNLSGNTLDNDTIVISVADELCYNFEIKDENIGDELQAFTISPEFSGANPPSFQVSGTNPLVGEVCWEPSCDLGGELVSLVFGGRDMGICGDSAQVLDTVFVRIEAVPNAPPTAVHNLGGLNAVNDTIFVNAEENLCYDIVFNDLDLDDTLDISALSGIFGSADGATFSVAGTNPVQVQVCWTPSCDYDGQLIPLILNARDQDICNNILDVSDTVFVKIDVPLSIPPQITQNLSGTNNSNDTIYLNVGENICYDFSVIDQTLNSDFDYDFEFQNLAGEDAGLGTVDVEKLNGRIDGKICFQSDCTNGGSTYRLIINGQDARRCPPASESSDTVFIRVFTDFESEAGPDISYCEGSGGSQLSVNPIGGTGPYYYQWGCTDPPNCGISDPNSSNPTVNPTGTTTYFVQVTDRFGCTSEFDSVSIKIDALPLVDTGPDLAICDVGESVQLQAEILNEVETGGGPFIFQWFPAEGLDDPTSPTPIAQPTTSTIYTVVVSGANGCNSSSTNLDTTASVTVNVSERPDVMAGDNRIVCAGDSVQITGFASGAGPTYQYSWTDANGVPVSNQQSPWVSPASTTTYYLTASSNGCGGPTDSLTVEVLEAPTANPSPLFEICATESIQLDGTGSSQGGALKYSWSPAEGLDDPTSPTPIASPQSDTRYTLVVSSEDGCKSQPYAVDVSIKPTPKANAGDDGFICRSDSIVLEGSHTFYGGINPPGSPIYTWSPAVSLNDPSTAKPKASPSGTELYTLTVSFGDCQTSDQVKIDVFNQISAQVSSSDTEICAGDSINLNAQGGIGSAIFRWSPATGLSDPFSSSPTASPNGTTTYVVEIAESGCVAKDSITIDVLPSPIAGFFLSDSTGCPPLEVTYVANEPNATSYSWTFSDGNGNNPTSQMVSKNYTDPGSYTVKLEVTAANGCQTISQTTINVAPEAIANFSSDPPAGSSITLPNTTVNFLNLSQFADNYLWKFGGQDESTDTDPTYDFKEPGDYTVSLIAFSGDGCNDTINFSYQVLSPELFIPNVFSPNQDGVNDSFRVRYQGSETYIMEIFDRWGKKMFEDRNPNPGWNGIAPTGNPAGEGVYYYSITIGTKTYTGNLTLVR